MKKFLTIILILAILVVSSTCYALYLLLSGYFWLHVLLFAVSALLFLPAFLWWKAFLFRRFGLESL